MNSAGRTEWIQRRAQALGIDLCGVSRAEHVPGLERVPEWLAHGYAGAMRYLEDARRRDVARVLSGVRSVVVCGLNYQTNKPLSTHVPADGPGEEPRGWISRYAWGADYHEILGKMLAELVAGMRKEFEEEFEARWYVDTGPVHERAFARQAGLGWIGKHTLLINEAKGSFLFLGVILTTLELEPSVGEAEVLPPDLCGNCRLCLEACPTGAIVEPYLLDARRCISYLTIELRGMPPEELREKMGRHVFGCDICQDVCPWNRETTAGGGKEFWPREAAEITGETAGEAGGESMFHPRLEWLAGLSEEEFQEIFRGSAVRRTKWRGLLRNACIALGNSVLGRGSEAHARITGLLRRLAASPEQVVAESARWALSRIEGRGEAGSGGR